MRNNIISSLAITLLTIGTIAGYASGIYSVTHRGRSCDRSSWHERADRQERFDRAVRTDRRERTDRTEGARSVERQ